MVTLDTMLLGWRPHDLDTAYLPFAHGVGIQVRLRASTYRRLVLRELGERTVLMVVCCWLYLQVGTSDPVFMKKMGLEARTGESAHCAFPFDPEAMDKKRAEGTFLPFVRLV